MPRSESGSILGGSHSVSGGDGDGSGVHYLKPTLAVRLPGSSRLSSVEPKSPQLDGETEDSRSTPETRAGGIGVNKHYSPGKLLWLASLHGPLFRRPKG